MNLLDLMQAPQAAEPAVGTQNRRLLDFLREGRVVDPLTAWRALGIYRLGSRIHDLRKAGWPIVGERKAVRNRFGEEINVSHYRLETK
jgi:hypothetical protein